MNAAEVWGIWKNHTLFTFQKMAVIELYGVYHCVGLEIQSCFLGSSLFVSCDIITQRHLQIHRCVTFRSQTFYELGRFPLSFPNMCQGNLLRAVRTSWICALTWGLGPKSLSHS